MNSKLENILLKLLFIELYIILIVIFYAIDKTFNRNLYYFTVKKKIK